MRDVTLSVSYGATDIWPMRAPCPNKRPFSAVILGETGASAREALRLEEAGVTDLFREVQSVVVAPDITSTPVVSDTRLVDKPPGDADG